MLSVHCVKECCVVCVTHICFSCCWICQALAFVDLEEKIEIYRSGNFFQNQNIIVSNNYRTSFGNLAFRNLMTTYLYLWVYMFLRSTNYSKYLSLYTFGFTSINMCNNNINISNGSSNIEQCDESCILSLSNPNAITKHRFHLTCLHRVCYSYALIVCVTACFSHKGVPKVPFCTTWNGWQYQMQDVWRKVWH